MSTTNYVLPTLDRTLQMAYPPESCSPVFYDLGLAPITWTFLLLFALSGLAAANVHQKDFLRVPEQLHRASQYNHSMMGYLKLWGDSKNSAIASLIHPPIQIVSICARAAQLSQKPLFSKVLSQQMNPFKNGISHLKTLPGFRNHSDRVIGPDPGLANSVNLHPTLIRAPLGTDLFQQAKIHNQDPGPQTQD